MEKVTNFPFAEKPEEKVIGSGGDSLVHRMGSDWVYKEVNPKNPAGGLRSPGYIQSARSRETVLSKMEEQQRLLNIFGKKHFVESHYVYGENPQGEREYMLVQKFIKGRNLDELIHGETPEYQSLAELVEDKREQFKHIVWATKKAIIEFGVPLDFNLDNFMLEEDTGNIVLIDSGSPAKDFEDLSKPEVAINIPEERVRGFLRRIGRIREIEELMHLTNAEKTELDSNFGISTGTANELMQQMERKMEEMGKIKQERRREEIGVFLDTVFGERNTVYGGDIVKAAIRILGEDEIPEKTRATIGLIKSQEHVEGDRQHWLELIMQQE